MVEKEKTTTTIRLPATLLRDFTDLARSEDQTVSQMLRKYMREELRRRPTYVRRESMVADGNSDE